MITLIQLYERLRERRNKMKSKFRFNRGDFLYISPEAESRYRSHKVEVINQYDVGRNLYLVKVLEKGKRMHLMAAEEELMTIYEWDMWGLKLWKGIEKDGKEGTA